MKKHNRLFILFTLLLATIFILAACGGSEPAAVTEEAPAQEEAAPAEEATEAPAMRRIDGKG